MIEKRNFQVTEFRAFQNEEGERFVEGYAALFDSRSKLLSSWDMVFYEELRAGSFAEALERSDLDVVFVPDHNSEKVIARSKAGTLELKEDEKGLYFKASVPDVTYANDMYKLMERGDLSDTSFAFNVSEEGFTMSETEEGIPLRSINKIDRLLDVSVVTRGAYAEPSAEARGLKEYIDQKEESKREDDSADVDQEDVKLRLRLIQLKNKNY